LAKTRLEGRPSIRPLRQAQWLTPRMSGSHLQRDALAALKPLADLRDEIDMRVDIGAEALVLGADAAMGAARAAPGVELGGGVFDVAREEGEQLAAEAVDRAAVRLEVVRHPRQRLQPAFDGRREDEAVGDARTAL